MICFRSWHDHAFRGLHGGCAVCSAASAFSSRWCFGSAGRSTWGLSLALVDAAYSSAVPGTPRRTAAARRGRGDSGTTVATQGLVRVKIGSESGTHCGSRRPCIGGASPAGLCPCEACSEPSQPTLAANPRRVWNPEPRSRSSGEVRPAAVQQQQQWAKVLRVGR